MDNSALNSRICINDANTLYSGAFTLQIWELNGTGIPAAFGGVNGSVAGGAPYTLLASSGFTLEETIFGHNEPTGCCCARPGVHG